MNIVKQTDGGYVVSSPGTREDILLKYGKHVSKSKINTTPMVEAAMRTKDPNSVAQKLSPVNRTLYASLAMSLMFLGRMTRAEILFACTVAATRISDPDEDDLQDLFRILQYIANTPNFGVLYEGGMKALMKVFTDASHGIHGDGKGHGGIIIMLGTGYVFAKSGKIKTVTLSSTESEGYMMCDAATYIVWMRELLSFFSYDMSIPTRML